jgi:hypothetical protein
MFCRECGAIVPEMPERGARDAPDPRDVRDEREVDDVMARRRRFFLYGFGAIFLVLMVSRMSSLAWLPWTAWMGGANSGRSWNGWGGHDRSEAGGTPVVTDATTVFETYRDNKNAARAKFADRPLVVTGTFVRIDGFPPLGPDLMLATSDEDELLRADLVQRSTGLAATLKPGDEVTVGCRHVEENIGPDPWLRSCQIEEAPKPFALPAPPPLPSLTTPDSADPKEPPAR